MRRNISQSCFSFCSRCQSLKLSACLAIDSFCRRMSGTSSTIPHGQAHLLAACPNCPTSSAVSDNSTSFRLSGRRLRVLCLCLLLLTHQPTPHAVVSYCNTETVLPRPTAPSSGTRSLSVSSSLRKHKIRFCIVLCWGLTALLSRTVVVASAAAPERISWL